MTGTFFNPGPYGGFIAIIVAICGSYSIIHIGEYDKDKYIIALPGLAAIAGSIVLPASMSRAAWLGLFIAILLFIIINRCPVWVYLMQHKWALSLIIILSITFGTIGFMMKKDSALGRLHIWRIECRIIAKHPIKGTGPGSFPYEYGIEQANFFREKERSADIVRIAGCPEYAFNEYLKAGVELGVIGLILSFAITLICCVVLIRNNSPFGYGCMVLATFSFFSYPMSLWPFLFLFGMFITLTLRELLKSNEVKTFFTLLCIVICFMIMKGGSSQQKSFRDIYQQGYTMFVWGEYRGALELMERGAKMSSDPMFHNIMGRCYQALGEYQKAEDEYKLAHFMVPCRLYPLVLLQELYISQDDTLQANATLTQIRGMPINPQNNNMKRLLERAIDNAL